jgi:NAD kinase
VFKKIVIVTRRTRLQELVERFNTHSQAKFYIEHSGGDFADYEREDDSYRTALDLVRRSLDFELPHQLVDRALVPTYKFQKEDVVVTLGQDGLVANTAKYAGAQPIVAINPEPSRFDGILLPFLPDQARTAVGQILDAKAAFREVTLADATLNDGQRLLAFNDLFLGARSPSQRSTESCAASALKRNLQVVFWFRLARAPPAGFPPYSTWPRV